MHWKNPFRVSVPSVKSKPPRDKSTSAVFKTPSQDDHALVEPTLQIPPEDTSSWKTVITHIRANVAAADLGRIPIGFFVTVGSEHRIEQRTKNKPMLVHDSSIEWGDELPIPSKPPPIIHITVCASYEFSPMLGNGQTLRTFALDIGKLFQRSQMVDSFELSPLEGEPMSPCSLLYVRVERRSRTPKMLTHVSNQQDYSLNTETSSSLAQITDEGHKYLLHYYEHKRIDDLKRSITCFDRALEACPRTHHCRAAVLSNLASAQFILCQDGMISDFNIPVTLYRSSLDLRPIGHPDRPATLLYLARATHSQFLKSGDESCVTEATILSAQAQSLCSEDSYEYQFAERILQECIPNEATSTPLVVNKLQGDTLCTPDPPSHEPEMLNALAFALLGRFQQHGCLDDLNESITAMEKAAELTEETDLEWPLRVVSLGLLIFRRSCLSNNVEDLDRSVSVLDKVSQRVSDGHPDRPTALINLGSILVLRFGLLKWTPDINRSLHVLEEAQGLLTDDHPNRSPLLVGLGVAFLEHYRRRENPVHLARSISLMERPTRRASGDLEHPFSTSKQPTLDLFTGVFTRKETLNILLNDQIVEHTRLVNLYHALLTRFDCSGDRADLDKSIAIKEELLEAPSGVSKPRFRNLTDLGCLLLMRHNRFGDMTDLPRSASLLAEAVRLTPNDDPDRSIILAAFGLSGLYLSDQLGRTAGVDRAISVEEAAIQHTSDHDPNKPISLISLSLSFLKRFGHIKNPVDLDKAISLMEEAVLLIPPAAPKRGRFLTVLGCLRATRFGLHGRIVDLNESTAILEEAEQTILDSDVNSKVSVLLALCCTLQLRSHHLGDATDIKKSIVAGEKAVALCPAENSLLPRLLVTLGSAFLVHAAQKRKIAYLDKSNSLMERAIDIMPESYGNRPLYLIGIGASLWARFLSLKSLPALHSAISCSSSAACSPSGQPLVQFRAFKLWFECAISLRNVSRVEGNRQLLEAFKCAISLFPQLAWLGLPLNVRFTMLREAADITRSAISLVVSLGETKRAVEWLEQGRCIVWGQLLQVATPLDALRLASPDLADQFERLSSALRQSGAVRDIFLPLLSEESGDEESLEQQARRHRELVEQRENLLELIQTVPGFEGCFSPKRFSQLRESARFGPIILLHARVDCGDALIVVAHLDEPIHVPLPGINERHAEHLRTSLQQLLLNDGRVFSRDCSHRAARLVGQNTPGFNYILSELWNRVVRPVLHALALFEPGNPARVFWCPTGPLSFLPIHAAGNYDVSRTGSKASDFVISSYIPTLSALLSSTELTTASDDIRLLAVPQPQSDGQMRLYGAPVEIRYIRETIGTHPSSRIRLQESDGNIEGVLNAMEQSDWVHFACHGVQDAQNPTDSGLCLADGRRLRLSDISRLSRPRRGLAFLSACQTATGAVELSEEAVHLAAGMLFAGYSSVIGTMWSIGDSVAPELAKDVYEQLFRDGRAPDSREAARALHNAVERLRQSGAPFIAWVPFIHMGL